MKKVFVTIIVIALIAGVVYFVTKPLPDEITLTGIITTDEVLVSAQIQGRLDKLHVREGDSVTNGQLLAEIQPDQYQADITFYASNEKQSSSDLTQAKADLEIAKLNFERMQGLYSNKVESVQSYDQTRTTFAAAKAKMESIESQIQGVAAQKKKADVYLSYTKILAPIDGIVDTRAALQGEVVNPGQAIVTLINQSNLWVRADVEETYIDRIHLGDKLQLRLPSGAMREGTVFFRGVDADYATQRDVSRTKRDIKTFEVRLRCDNSDRALAIGMTAYVTLPLPKP